MIWTCIHECALHRGRCFGVSKPWAVALPTLKLKSLPTRCVQTTQSRVNRRVQSTRQSQAQGTKDAALRPNRNAALHCDTALFVTQHTWNTRVASLLGVQYTILTIIFFYRQWRLYTNFATSVNTRYFLFMWNQSSKSADVKLLWWSKLASCLAAKGWFLAWDRPLWVGFGVLMWFSS